MNSEPCPVSLSARKRCVLLVDDDPTQLKLNQTRLRAAGYDVETAGGADEALSKVRLRSPDAIVSDVLMSDLDGFELCHRLREEACLKKVPVILLSSHFNGDADRALASRVGASALLARTPDFDIELEALRASLKSQPPPPSTLSNDALYDQHLRRNANQLSQLAHQVRSADERYRTLFENASDAISVLSPEGVILEVNERWREVMGIAPEAMIGRHIRDFAPRGREEENVAVYQQTIASTGRTPAVPILRPDGATIYMEFSLTTISTDGKVLVFAIGRDVTSNVLSAQALAEAEEKYRSLLVRIPDVVWSAEASGKIRYVTPNVVLMCGFTPNELYAGGSALWFSRIDPEDLLRVEQAYERMRSDHQPFDLEYRFQRKDDQWIWLRYRAFVAQGPGGVRHVEGIISDITEKRKLEQSLQQAQKMEAIGQLTAGVAHDFNNLLAAIVANCYFLIGDLAEGTQSRTDAEEIQQAAERATALTRQLLAFSRTQLLQPNTTDINGVVDGLKNMLCRMIGEDVELTFNPGHNLGQIRVDVGQLEQVIMNLVVNARDAMPLGGKIAIDTARVDIDTFNTASDLCVAPGSYVVLSVKDTGCGMDSETQARIFDPFFTTKEVGKGTGLGLSTSYGIVKQSEGFIRVESELGRGSVFRVYLPVTGSAPEPRRPVSDRPDLGGTETILVVEDDAQVCGVVGRMLGALGYRVLLAKNGEQARAMVEQDGTSVDLVMSDVIMPGASGPELMNELRRKHPQMRVLFMSGYADHAALRDSAVQLGTNFIQKPFSPAALAKKIRRALDA